MTDFVPRQDLDSVPTNGEGLDVLISAIGAVASIQDADTAPTAAVDLDRSNNAVSVLLSALPSDVVASLNSELKILASATSRASTATPTSSTSEPTGTSSRPSTLISSTTSTTSQPASSTSSSPTAAASSSRPSHDRAAIAGIASGVIAGAVLLILAAVFLLKYRKHGRVCCFGRKPIKPPPKSQNRYPESAWLYDPSPTPPDPLHQIRSGSSAATLLRMCEEDEMAEHDQDRNPDRFSSPTRPIRQTSPLLQPRRDDEMMEVDRTPDRFASPTRPPRATSPLLSTPRTPQIRMVAPSPTASPRMSDAKWTLRTSMAASFDDDRRPRRESGMGYHAH